jgi:beta-mannosidase
VEVTPLSSKVYLDWPLKKLTDAGAADTSRVVIVADLTVGGTQISRNLVYLAPVREVQLKQAMLKAETAGANGSYRIRVTSPVLARSVYLSFGDLDVKLSDNYFDLLPGETAEIDATSAATLEALKAQLKVISLRDAFGDEGRRTTVTAAP